MNKENINKLELYFFYIILLINLIPVFSVKFFPSVDGPAHLYNSNIINQLVFFGSSPLSNYFILNPEIVPNWVSHLILSTFNLFLPAYLAEKMLLILYFLSLPLAFRKLVKVISPDHYYLSYIIFPFSYSTLLLMGFYNFSIGLIFLFLTLAIVIKNEGRLLSPRVFLSIFVLFLLTYFSHIFVFVILIISITSILLVGFTATILNRSTTPLKVIAEYTRKSLYILLAAIVPLILFAFYYFTRHSSNDYPVYLSFTELYKMLKDMHAIIVYNINLQDKYTIKLAWITFALFFIAIYLRTQVLFGAKKSTSIKFRLWLANAIQQADCWLVIGIIILCMFFKMPDSSIMGGFVSIRLSLLFYMMFFLWLSRQIISNWVSIPAVIIILFLHFGLMIFNINSLKELNNVAVDCYNTSQYVKPYHTVLPVNCSDNWLHYHFDNYIGVDKPIAMLENYECQVGYFPVKWNEKQMPDLVLGDLRANQLEGFWWKSNRQNELTPIDYVFVLGNLDVKLDTSSIKIKEIIKNQYTRIYQNANCKLYALKNKPTI